MMQEQVSNSANSADGAKGEKDEAAQEPIRARGLENVIALESEMSFIDGQQGVLSYRGYDIHELAEHASFEEVVYLLWNGELPDRRQLDALSAQLRAERALPDAVIEMLRSVPEGAHPMAVLRTATSMLAHFDDEADAMERGANERKALRVLAQMPTILAAFDRLRKGQDPVAPPAEGAEDSTAKSFLTMLTGEAPGEAAERTFDVCLVLHADHGLNASTFTARVIGSTLSDLYSAVTGAIGALKGPLHGGANVEVMKMLREIDRQGADPSDYVRRRLQNKERVMGFGHRVYKTMDPRAAILRDMVEELSEEKDERKWYDYSMEILETMQQEKGLDSNVDFFSASIYHLLGIDIDLFTPIFALSRTAGWTAHLLEQWEDNRLIRPRAAYVGEKNRTMRPIEER